ncbi:MAG TPA: RDD family protein [Pseudomonadota bacterium]|nr:RDD family protein [Rhodanobacteraceae bacterium]MBP9154857.1 RDD family protein [Xanthomonadales bacterium]HQW81301.1 RDD family protein [Pseudomonadota bacterium]
MSDAWYVAEPDGNTWGPYVHQDLLRAAAAQMFATNALVWHVDFGEWQPLAKHVARVSLAPPSSVPPREVIQPVVLPRVAKPAIQDKTSKPPPLAAHAPKIVAKDRAQIESLLRQADARKAATDVSVAQSAKESSRRLFWVTKRLAARYVDVMSLGLLGASAWWAATEGAKGPESQTLPEFWMLLSMACAVWFVVESLLIGLFGTTPGKYLFGLRVRDERGEVPGLARAFGRSFHLYVRGIAFGLLFLTPFAIFIAGAQTLHKGSAPWDGGLTVEDEAIGSRWQVSAFMIVVLWIAAVEGWWLDLAAMLVH